MVETATKEELSENIKTKSNKSIFSPQIQAHSTKKKKSLTGFNSAKLVSHVATILK